MNQFYNSTLALASVLQTATLVDQLAHSGFCDKHSNKVSLNSIITPTTNIEEIYSSPKDLSIGLKTLSVAFDKKTKSLQNIIFYSLALINLEKKLMKNAQLVSQLTSQLSNIQEQDFYDIDHNNSLAKLATIYKDTLGKLNPRIMVSGEELYLSNERTANHIRALLLAGIRAVSLWKSQGGKPWHLIFQKKKIVNCVKSIDI
jgi:high frequency lysogenization protein